MNACYDDLEKVDKEIATRFGPDAGVIANYTGGTKTMSVALALFAVLGGCWHLSLNKGPRRDLMTLRELSKGILRFTGTTIVSTVLLNLLTSWLTAQSSGFYDSTT